jgi:hypothetical protein
MKFIPLTLLSYLIAAVAKADVLKGTSSLFKDDQNYWKRLLAEGVGSVTSPPTVKDSENPSPSPSDLPSTMTKSCLIEVSVGECSDLLHENCQKTNIQHRYPLLAQTRTVWIVLQ